MAVNSKAKGSSFERKLCKELSLWWTHGEREDVFWRSAGSGARATNAHRSGGSIANAEGDIVYSDAIGKPFTDFFCIELKTGYGDWSVMDLLETNQKVTQFEKFWEQVSESALHSKAFPLLIYRKDRRNTIVAFDFEAWRQIYNHKKASQALVDVPHIDLHIPYRLGRVYIYKLEDFFEALKPEYLKEIVNGVCSEEA